MANEKDFMDQAVEEFMGWTDEQKTEPTQTTVETPPPVQTEPEKQIPKADVPPVVKEFTQEEILKKFNELSGLNLQSFDEAKQFNSKLSKYEELEQTSSVVPELLDILEKTQNPMNYFADENSFKVSMLGKELKYKGKENILNEIIGEDLTKVDDLHIIALASSLNASKSVRNPLKAELRSMGLNPDEVMDDYASLEEDVKDLLTIRADKYREELSGLGKDIKLPTFEGTTVEKLLNQKKAFKEDLDVRLNKVLPVASNIVEEVKDIKLSDDFNYVLNLSKADKDEYSSELAKMVVSGEFDLNTEDGKSQIYGTLMNMIKADHFEKAVSAYTSFVRSKVEEEMRKKYNNETDLSKSEPNVFTPKTEEDIISSAANWLISDANRQ